MNAQESGASALAGIALQLTLLDKPVEKGVLAPEEVQTILLDADAKIAQSPNMTCDEGVLLLPQKGPSSRRLAP